MKFRKFFNQKGITLIEVLAGISLFAVVTILFSSVITQVSTSEKKIEGNNTLNRRINVAITDLRDNHCLNNKDPNITYTFSGVTVDRDGCLEVNENERISFTLTASDDVTNQEVSVQTALTNLKESINDNDSSFDVGELAKCYYLKHTVFKDGLEIKNASGKPCERYIFFSSVNFNGDLFIHNHTPITAYGAVNVDGNLTIKPNSKLTVHDNLYVIGTVTLQGNGNHQEQLCVDGKFNVSLQHDYKCN